MAKKIPLQRKALALNAQSGAGCRKSRTENILEKLENARDAGRMTQNPKKHSAMNAQEKTATDTTNTAKQNIQKNKTKRENRKLRQVEKQQAFVRDAESGSLPEAGCATIAEELQKTKEIRKEKTFQGANVPAMDFVTYVENLLTALVAFVRVAEIRRRKSYHTLKETTNTGRV